MNNRIHTAYHGKQILSQRMVFRGVGGMNDRAVNLKNLRLA